MPNPARVTTQTFSAPTMTISSPTFFGKYIASSTGTIRVEGVIGGLTTKVYLTCVDAAAATVPPDHNGQTPADNGYTEATISGGSYSADLSLPIASPGTCKVVGYPFDTIGKIYGPSRRTRFRLMENMLNTQVFATCCTWYALAPGGLAPDPRLPFGNPVAVDYEDPDQHRPVEVEVPRNAAEVTITVTTIDETLANDDQGTPKTDARGHANFQTALEVTAYQSALLGSDKISPLVGQAPVNRFVGLWKTAADKFQQFDIGMGVSNVTVPSDAKTDRRLFLAIHDGKRWCNNSGAIDVSIHWHD